MPKVTALYHGTMGPRHSVSIKKWIRILEGHGIMNTSGLLQSKWSPKGFTLILQESRSIHGSMSFPKIEFNAYIYILL